MSITELDDIKRRLQRLEDIEEIQDLANEYHQYINEGYWDRFQDLFTDDGVIVIDYVSEARGKAAIKELFVNVVPDHKLTMIKHYNHAHQVRLDGDEATGIRYLEGRYGAEGQSLMLAGCYREKYRRTAEGWRFQEVVLKLHFSVPIGVVGWAAESLHTIESVPQDRVPVGASS